MRNIPKICPTKTSYDPKLVPFGNRSSTVATWPTMTTRSRGSMFSRKIRDFLPTWCRNLSNASRWGNHEKMMSYHDLVSFWVAKLWDGIEILKPLPWELKIFTPIQRVIKNLLPQVIVCTGTSSFHLPELPHPEQQLHYGGCLGAQACRFPTMGVSHHRSPASEGCEPFDSTWINTVWPLACIWSWPSWHAWIKILHGLTCRAMCFDINFWAPILKIFFGGSLGQSKWKYFTAVLSATGQRRQQLRLPHEVADQHWGGCPQPSDCSSSFGGGGQRALFAGESCWYCFFAG